MRCNAVTTLNRLMKWWLGGDVTSNNRLFLLREFAAIVRNVRAHRLPVGQVQAEQSAAGAEGGQRADPAMGQCGNGWNVRHCWIGLWVIVLVDFDARATRYIMRRSRIIRGGERSDACGWATTYHWVA